MRQEKRVQAVAKTASKRETGIFVFSLVFTLVAIWSLSLYFF